MNTKIKSALLLITVAAVALGSSSCGLFPGTSTVKVQAGHAALRVQQYGNAKGIDNAQLVNGGKVWYNGWTEDVIVFPLYVNAYPFTRSTAEGNSADESITFSVGGSSVNVDSAVAFQFSTDPSTKKDKPDSYTELHDFYATYRKTPKEFIDTNLRQALRTCFGSSSEQLGLTPSMLATKSTALTTSVTSCLARKFPQIAISEVSLQSEWRLESSIQESIDAQFAAQQAAQTAISDQQKATAEALTNVAKAKGEAEVDLTKARAKAEANRLLAGSVTPELIRLRQLDVEMAEIAKWDGVKAPTIQTPNVQLGSKTATAQ
jgi:regulator of protease activity HflC (stomatin/prohibitin superfamily)